MTQTAEPTELAPVEDVAGETLEHISTTPVEDTEARVRRWVGENLAHGMIARDPRYWNEIQAAIPALVQIIDA